MNQQKSDEEIKVARETQATLCKAKNYPQFVSDSGACYSCRRNVYQNYERHGYDGTHLVTGCPHCNRSFCD